MKPVNAIPATCGAALLTAAIATAAWAQGPANEKTYLTFSAPIEIPGQTLPAGTYTFKLADSLSNRHIVQIFDKEESKIFATILAVPAQRNEVTGDTVITFAETPVGTPAAIRYWYYPGDKIGQEFVYPKDQATRIAKASGQTVLATDSDSADAEEMRSGNVVSVSPTGEISGVEMKDIDSEGRTAEAPAEPVTPAEPVPAPAPETRATTTTTDVERQTDTTTGTTGRAVTDRDVDRDRLPQTASPLPLVTLIGFGSIAAAAGIRRLRRRR